MFTIQVLASFLVGGLLIAMQTIAGEHVPPRWRGVVLTIPSTMAMGLFFIGLSKGPGDVGEAAKVIPASLGACYLFVAAFAFFSRYGLFFGFLGGYVVWATTALCLLHFPPPSIGISIVAYFVPLVILSYAFSKRLVSHPSFSPVPFRWNHLIIRSLIGGAIVAGTVILAKTLGNVWGGLFSAFPAAFTAMFLIYGLAYGTKVIPAVALSVFFPGSIGFVLYLAAAAWAFPQYGIWIGTLAAYAASVPFYILFVFFRDRKSLAEKEKVG